MSPLNVYKASAGSGKTFALTLEYLKLLFRNPGIHRHILAVTFTNKAAGEMKQRILGRLYELSRYDGSAPMEEMVQLMRDTGMDESVISRKAGELLKTILNDYSGFSVGTIDKFFQSVIRAFTREIGIQPGYNLELDHNRVLSLAVDRLFHDISDHKELQRWLIRFAEERMEESRSWNFRNDMVQLGMQLFRESFQGLFFKQDLSVLDKENLEHYLDDLKRVEEDTLQQMAGIGNSALDHLKQSGLEIGDFRLKGNSPPSLFQEAVAGRSLKFTQAKLDSLEQPAKWLNKSATVEMTRLTEQVLMPLLNQLYIKQKVLNTIVSIRQNFYTLGILGDIWERVKSYTRERNLFLIADSSRFLRGIIGGNQVPFIYERTGNRYTHIMLDEFQDTSLFQYDNFKPLLDNALALGHNNLVVGDVKQSIYRWRNSDWKILASDLETDFSHQEFHMHTLVKNFRSSEQIVRFNNTVFKLVPQLLAQTIENELYSSAVIREEVEKEILRFRKAYADAIQQIPDKLMGSGGMVKVELFEEEEERPFMEQVLSRLPEWIHEIQLSGIDPGEIAILVRSRREGVAVANRLLEHARSTGETHKYRLISNESLLLAHNSSVSLLLSALRYLVYPHDALNNALFKYLLNIAEVIPGREPDALFDTSIAMEQLLPEEFLDSIHIVRKLPLYELVESLIKLFRLDQRPQDLPYLQALQELVIDIHRKEPQGIAEFLHFWEQHGSKKGISLSEESNAIRILTIHKAKGLEFKAVVVPFCNWEITTDQKKSNILWCDTAGTPFNRLPTVPVRFSNKMQHTHFSRAYQQERMKGYMDNLNLMYVAFTRAKEAMFIGIPDTATDTLRSAGDLLRAIIDKKPDCDMALDSLETYRSEQIISLGSLSQHKKRPVEEDPWQFSAYPVNQRTRTLKVRMRSDEYFVDEDGTFRTGQMYGNVMHKVFSRISSVSDVNPLLNRMQKEGLLPHKDRIALQEEILEMITQPGVERWFSERADRSIYNERSLLCGDGKMLRPDRVIVEGELVTVVDFKFGGLVKDQYREQVRNYMQQLGKAGYRKVEGFVWYVRLGKTIQIENV
ncbi:MAG: UvrD-helicase domain-containing protein [Bacteroidota bacterium]